MVRAIADLWLAIVNNDKVFFIADVFCDFYFELFC